VLMAQQYTLLRAVLSAAGAITFMSGYAPKR
jgi:hypothetical protein